MKKIEINVVSTHLGHSPVIVSGDGINVVQVKELPEGLCTKMMCLLHFLEREGVTAVTVVEHDEGGSFFVLNKGDRNVTLKDLHPDNREYFTETVELLVWHFKEHFYLSPPLLGGQCRCIDCGRAQEQPFGPNKCQNYKCSSHEKRKDIDPAYVATTQEDDPIAHRFKKMHDEINEAVADTSHTTIH